MSRQHSLPWPPLRSLDSTRGFLPQRQSTGLHWRECQHDLYFLGFLKAQSELHGFPRSGWWDEAVTEAWLPTEWASSGVRRKRRALGVGSSCYVSASCSQCSKDLQWHHMKQPPGPVSGAVTAKPRSEAARSRTRFLHKILFSHIKPDSGHRAGCARGPASV